MRNIFWAFVLAIIAMFVFFLALGAFNAGDVMEVTVAVSALTALWIAHAVISGRHAQERDRGRGRGVLIHARERHDF